MLKYIANMSQTERITDVVAVAGASSWWWSSWMPWINETILVPLATLSGIIWLLVQIYYKIWKEPHNDE